MDYINEKLKVWINKFIDWGIYNQFKTVMNTVLPMYDSTKIFPEQDKLLRVFKETLPTDIKVILIGMGIRII